MSDERVSGGGVDGHRLDKWLSGCDTTGDAVFHIVKDMLKKTKMCAMGQFLCGRSTDNEVVFNLAEPLTCGVIASGIDATYSEDHHLISRSKHLQQEAYSSSQPSRSLRSESLVETRANGSEIWQHQQVKRSSKKRESSKHIYFIQ